MALPFVFGFTRADRDLVRQAVKKVTLLLADLRRRLHETRFDVLG
jgi:hypothetical protein